MLTDLRREITALLQQYPTRRPCALRRSLHPDFLLAVDLPLAAEEDTVQAFIQRAEQEGWTVRQEKGWLLLDHALPQPTCCKGVAPSGRLGNAIWLLRLHPSDVMDAGVLCLLAKAAEEGEKAVERVCDGCVRDWAVRLRRREALPGGLLPYMLEVACLQEERREKP